MRKITNLIVMVFFITLSLTVKLSAFYDDEDEDENTWKIKSNCPVLIEASANSINIGSFYNGYNGSDIPAPDGTSNFIEFTIFNYWKNEIIVNSEFKNIPDDNNSVRIESWTWEFIDDEYPTTWSNPSSDVNIIQKNMKLIRNTISGKSCESYARIRLTLNRISVRPDAISGQAMFAIVISATTN